MSELGILVRGCSYNLEVKLKDKQGVAVNWDTVTDFNIVVYSKTKEIKLKSFLKQDLIIDDASSGLAIAFIPGDITETALLDMYIFHYKYKVGNIEVDEKGYWGTFIKSVLEKQHFEIIS